MWEIIADYDRGIAASEESHGYRRHERNRGNSSRPKPRSTPSRLANPAAERKKDTRRKIVLGGALLELSKSDKDASGLVTRLIAGLSRDHDEKLFEKGVRKEAGPEPAKVETPAVQPVAAPTPPPEAPKTLVLSSMPDYVPPPVRRDRDEI